MLSNDSRIIKLLGEFHAALYIFALGSILFKFEYKNNGDILYTIVVSFGSVIKLMSKQGLSFFLNLRSYTHALLLAYLLITLLPD